ncbi:hypothetical protein PAMP_019646 [Pampus punctatissimus]
MEVYFLKKCIENRGESKMITVASRRPNRSSISDSKGGLNTTPTNSKRLPSRRTEMLDQTVYDCGGNQLRILVLFRSFCGLGLLSNDYPGSPYPKKHLQGILTSRKICRLDTELNLSHLNSYLLNIN